MTKDLLDDGYEIIPPTYETLTKEHLEKEVIREFMDKPDISLCNGCHCMTHTVKGKCGKCGYLKAPAPEKPTSEQFKAAQEALHNAHPSGMPIGIGEIASLLARRESELEARHEAEIAKLRESIVKELLENPDDEDDWSVTYNEAVDDVIMSFDKTRTAQRTLRRRYET